MLGISTISFSNAFSDLPKEHWAYEKVETMTSKGVITGYKDGTFKPEKSVTREEFATILTKTLELDSSEFTYMNSLRNIYYNIDDEKNLLRIERMME